MTLSFYALDKGGILLYSQQVLMQEACDKQLNPILVAGFLSAIEHFVEELMKQNLDAIEMGDYKLIFSDDHELDCIFCLVYQKNSDEQKYKYLLSVLKALFINQFKSHINKKGHNLSIYKKFDPVIELILDAFDVQSQLIRVEHFLCGFLGYLRDFQTKNDFLCPNCKKTLVEREIDYRIVQ